MSVLIRGMEMPTSCHVCVAGFGGLCYFGPSGDECECPDNGRPDWCSLIEIQPHGRLIDADAFEKHIKKDWEGYDHWIAVEVENRPTVIEAEEVYGQYTDTAGNFHWCGTHSGEHTIKAEEGET